MAQLAGLEPRAAVFDQLRKGGIGTLVREASKRAQRFEFADRGGPLADPRTVRNTPGFHRHRELRNPDKDRREGTEELVARRIEIFHPSFEAPDLARCRQPAVLERALQRDQRRGEVNRSRSRRSRRSTSNRSSRAAGADPAPITFCTASRTARL